MRRRFWAVALASLALHSVAVSATYHVDAARGDDSREGTAQETAWRTLGKAAGLAQPGDTVLVHPGVYHEHVRLERAGEPGRPITFRAAQIAPGATIVTGAVPELRRKGGPWQEEDAKQKLFFTPFNYRPARVLYDGVDLQAYPSLDALRKFRFDPVPGPQHGFYFDESAKRLYVRLHPSGRYGSTDPREHIMQVAPATGHGGASRHISKPEHFIFGIYADKPAYVVIEGFTLETPGLTGVFIRGHQVKIRRCWFVGCRTAVSGQSDSPDEAKQTHDVLIEYCDFGHYPTFDDVIEVAAKAEGETSRGKRPPPKFFWWQRKGGPHTYELGMAIKIGSRWTFRGNDIHDTVDGLSVWGISTSHDVEVTGNRFSRLIDNAVESENSAARLYIHHNVVRDVFEPFSWQPSGGIPWPGPVWVEQNLVWDSPETKAIWPTLGWERGCFKIHCLDENWQLPHMSGVPTNSVAASGDGYWVRHNTLWFPNGNLFSFGGLQNRQVTNFHFQSNLAITQGLTPALYRQVDLTGFRFLRNVGAPAAGKDPGPTSVFSGSGGKQLPSWQAVRFADPAKGQFDSQEPTVLAGAGIAEPLPTAFGPLAPAAAQPSNE